MKNITPSELVLLGLHDLEAVEKMNNKYSVDMSSWHEIRRNHCYVCFAGAVMAVSLKAPVDANIGPGSFGPEKERLLAALNALRLGWIAEALIVMKIPMPEGCQVSYDVPGYEAGPERFKQTMRHMAAYLKKFGL